MNTTSAPSRLPAPSIAAGQQTTPSDSGKDSGQKPRRSLHERIFHASVIRMLCSRLIEFTD
jgi:hypothetical protein